jgi:4-amino-4-deoxy-L-arabinose transferase-like glycosyltransferase
MRPHPPRSLLEWALITCILLVAALFRFHDLGNIPKGLEHDEVATWHMVATVLEGERPIYFEEGYGHEPLYNYLTALPLSLWGHNWLGERFWAPWFGMLAVAATYSLLRRLFNPMVGLSAAGLQATVLWAFFFNRLGLRLNQLPFLLCATAYCFWRGMEICQANRKTDENPQGADEPQIGWQSAHHVSGHLKSTRLFWFVLAGALMGLCFYTYMSSRVVPLIFGAFSVYLVTHDLWIEKHERRPGVQQLARRWWPLAICFAVAALVMAPLALYLLDRPQDMTTPQREEQVDRPLQELVQGNPGPVLENAWALLKMWNVDGERYWQLNYSHRPVFVEPIGGLLFWIGAVFVVWRWKEPRFALLALWIALGMVPSLLTSEAPSWPRTMLASPAALTLPGIAVWKIGWKGAWTEIRPSPLKLVSTALIVTAILFTAVLTYRDFLVVWPQHPRVRYAFQSSMTEAMRALDATQEATPVVMAGLSPHDMDPWTERSTLRRRDLDIRWVDTRLALVVPAGESARLVTLDITPVNPALAEWAGLGPGTVIAQGEVVPRGGTEHQDAAPVYHDPAYTVYLLDTPALRQRIEGAQHQAYVGGDPFAPAPLPTSPQFIGPRGTGLLRLSGYEWLTGLSPGAPVQLLTFWRVMETGPRSTVYGQPALRTFLHLLDRSETVVAGTDALGAAPDTWRAGDTIVQLHTFAVPAAPGVYAVEIGWYIPPDGPRLAIHGVDAPGQRILFAPVEVRP